jgi:hypothetical protein
MLAASISIQKPKRTYELNLLKVEVKLYHVLERVNLSNLCNTKLLTGKIQHITTLNQTEQSFSRGNDLPQYFTWQSV